MRLYLQSARDRLRVIDENVGYADGHGYNPFTAPPFADNMRHMREELADFVEKTRAVLRASYAAPPWPARF